MLEGSELSKFLKLSDFTSSSEGIIVPLPRAQPLPGIKGDDEIVEVFLRDEIPGHLATWPGDQALD